MAARFEGKVALVTGAGSGIGLATAKRLASEGARLALVGLDAGHLAAARDQVMQAGAPEALDVVCDVSQEAKVMACVDQVMQRFGRLDVVVNNAGLMSFKPLEQFTGEDWLRILGVDLLGAFYFTKQAFLRMRGGGAIVNVASVHAVRTTPQVAPYAAAKAALLSLTRSAALEGRGRGIRSNAVLPGAVETKMLRDNPEVKAGVEHIEPKELLQPADIAATIAWLASDDASHVQGVSLVVDGGRLNEL
ncbi:SDR family NAD(P)-dependent oxidoreductase [Ramlibacter sp. MMS24-I3-19]|uniref:SDR family NAD(P)-dependent oxidoreductase n=1 Tax=Ramlibacter sp. MMS24-I3-19 TaxID=3416606 RepID=UPI003CFD2EC6